MHDMMHPGLRQPIAIAAALIASFLSPLTPALAQRSAVSAYPSHAIRMIVPFPPGGPADTIARILAQRMSEHWSQPVLIENRPGGNTAVGAEIVAKSAADGYTLLVAMDSTLVMNPLVTPNLPYDPIKDFAPISLLTKNITLITTRSDGPNTIAELIAQARAAPGTLNMGAGTLTSRLGGLAFASATKIDVTLIPYKGSADITQGLLTHAVDFALDAVSNSLPLIQAGKFRALAKYSDRPLPILPDVPSLAAATGLPELRESGSWIGLVAPARTPRAVIDRIGQEVEGIYADPDIAKNLASAGLFAAASSPEQLDAFIRSETKRWGAVIGSGVADKILN